MIDTQSAVSSRKAENAGVVSARGLVENGVLAKAVHTI